MASLNQCNFIGRLTEIPQIKYLPNGDPVVNFSIAINEKYKDKTGETKEQTEFVRIVAFRKLAEIMGQYLKKGSQVFISGKMKTRKWQDQNGQDRYTTEIIADQMQMLGSKDDGNRGQNDHSSNRHDNRDSSGSQNYAAAKGGNMPMQNPQTQFEDDEMIPF